MERTFSSLTRDRRRRPLIAVFSRVSRILGLVSVLAGGLWADGQCTYSTWVWNTRTRRSESHQRISKLYTELSDEERGPVPGCSVCEEDQVSMVLEGIPPFQICRRYAGPVRTAFESMKREGFPVESVSAYRVGLSKGEKDASGRRTAFSHHSYGVAIDINAERNGLYRHCPQFGPGCQLLRGGPWQPTVAGTITADSAAYRAFRSIGWHWGGELSGDQKDFMHFSVSGG